MKKVLIAVLVSVQIGIGSYVSAREWELPGVDIITREERWADESWKRADSGFFNWAIADNANYEAWLEGIGVDRGGKFAARKASNEIKEKRKEFFLANYPDDRNVDDEILSEDGHDLRWAQGIKEHKTKLIIHHTAGSQKYTTPEEALSGVHDIYKYHAHQHGWGDIGYNFLIDPFGKIYEGRAGGDGVIAAHADYNNNSTVGIALMGNFDVEQPTPAMMSSLLRLLTALAWKYDIDPYKNQHYFTAVEYDPYIVVGTHESIVGHQDTKNTACPGDYVYAKIPEIKGQVAALLTYFKQKGKLDLSKLKTLTVDTASYFDNDAGRVDIDLDVSWNISCISADQHIIISECKARPGGVTLRVERDHDKSSGIKHFVVSAGTTHYLIDMPMVWQDDIKGLLIERKAEYIRTFSRPSFEKNIEKVQEHITTEQAKSLMQGDISVLLYDLTVLYDTREMACTAWCNVIIDGQTFTNAGFINVVEDKTTDSLRAFIDLKKYPTKSITLSSREPIEVSNYDRTGWGGTQNRFRGSITIQKWTYKHLDYGVIDRYIVINTLPFDDYLAGIGETSEAQHIEKLKAMALLVKWYALFYMTGKNPHPSLPTGVPYTAVDDPRIFQKYVGAAREDYGILRQKALQATDDEFVTYRGYLPILPYYHCSAGFTWSWLEKFGWTDTPWLTSVLDVAICDSIDFEGHGVGLSGVWAQKLASKGVPYKQILQYYYPGVSFSQE
jgi:hypothetical protein